MNIVACMLINFMSNETGMLLLELSIFSFVWKKIML